MLQIRQAPAGAAEGLPRSRALQSREERRLPRGVAAGGEAGGKSDLNPNSEP